MKNRQFWLRFKRIFKRAVFPFMGLASLVWFLIRIIPKPSRATYPCMRVAYPIASSFVTYLLSLFLTLCSFRKFRENIYRNRYRVAAIFFVVGVISGFWFLSHSDSSFADSSAIVSDHTLNEPMGTGIGIHPGRVVWVYDPDATNENCSGYILKDGIINDFDNLWFQDKNNNMTVISKMVEQAVLSLTDENSSLEAWDAIFRYFNQRKGKGDMGYKAGERVFIKTNATSAWGEPGQWGMYWEDLSKTESWRPDIAETNPYVVLSMLRELVNHAGVPQENIYVGDPMKQIYKNFYDLWHAEFPNINYLGNDVLPNYKSLDIVSLGRTPVVKSDTASLFYSDQRTVLEVESDKLYTILEQADYMINIPTMKAHGRAGITLSAKNHFGSHTQDNAEHLHNGLVSEPPHNDQPTRIGYGLYRVQVDIMEHKFLGGNTMLVLVDGLYPCDEAVSSPQKWNMEPFNGDWASSIFLSQDEVAIESVCFDFLRTEYNGTTPAECRPNWSGVDDYLHQVADSANWPEGIIYDPDKDGIFISSLGVHEHWDNAEDKQYSRNLGNETGIELVSIFGVSTAVHDDQRSNVIQSFILKQNYPNPFNSETTISYALSFASDVTLEIYDLTGKKVRTLVQGYQSAGMHKVNWDGRDQNGKSVASGMYIYKVSLLKKDNTNLSDSKRMLLIK